MITEGTYPVTEQECNEFAEISHTKKALREMQENLLNAQIATSKKEAEIWDKVVKRLDLDKSIKLVFVPETNTVMLYSDMLLGKKEAKNGNADNS